MKFKKLFLAVVLTLSVIGLAGCKAEVEAPEEVIKKFQSSAPEVKSGDFDLEFSLKGADAQDQLDFNGKSNMKFDQRDQKTRKMDMDIMMSGKMNTAGRAIDGDLSFMARLIGNDIYVKLNKINSSDETFKSIEPFIRGYYDRWQKISPELLPEDVRKFQPKDDAALAKEKQLRDLFKEAKIFVINKEYGIEKVNGVKTYHYGVQLDEQGVKDYLTKGAAIEGRTLNPEDLDDAVKAIKYLTDVELWIGQKDYYLYKGVVKLDGADLPSYDPTKGSVSMVMDLTLTADDYNKNMNIEAPADAEDFNPLGLLGGGTAAPDLLNSPALDSPLPSGPSGN